MIIIVSYGVTTLAALFLAIGFAALVKKKELWLMLLFISVAIVNFGYFSLSLSKTLGEALLANRISYLGSIFLPLCMLMTIKNVCRAECKKWYMAGLVVVSFLIFFVAATPGYTNWYYQEVSLRFVNGAASLEKVYGPLHRLYYIYLLAYFGMMLSVIGASLSKKKKNQEKQSVILLMIVFLNIAIWMIEQWADFEFEFLSISYIISELLLLLLYRKNQMMDKNDEDAVRCAGEVPVINVEEVLERWEAVSLLTAREKDVLREILREKKRKEIADTLCVTEHTIKKHTANIFSKFQVSSRKELFEKMNREK
ncbi:MAG: hypothetical protein IJ486_10585 [Firmicutes bacterium]|nr:hypothetical protein [Bacillota bacterium]